MVNNPAGVSAAGAWTMNVVSSVGIIAVNKIVMSTYGFGYVATLTSFHYVFTSLVGYFSAASGVLTNKTAVPLWELLWFTLVADLSVVGMNLSLKLNSVGFYQIAKLSIIPTVCVFEAILNGKTYTRPIIASVVVVVLGVGICTVTDVNINIVGLIAAAVAVLTTAIQQIYIGSLQKKYNIGSFDLLRQTSPVQAVSLVVCGPFFDYFNSGRNVLEFQPTAMAIAFILLSCTLAVFCNLSQYLCIGKFSATSFQVLGHMKTVCVLLIGWFYFRDKFTLKSFSGMLMAVLGMVLYSWAVEQAKAAQKTESTQKVTDEEKGLLMGESSIGANTTPKGSPSVVIDPVTPGGGGSRLNAKDFYQGSSSGTESRALLRTTGSDDHT